MENTDITVEVLDHNQFADTNFEKSLYELNRQIDALSSHADQFDYFVAVSSGILCGMLDILWVGEFDLGRGREYAQKEVDGLVKKTANLLGYKGDDIKGAVKFLEDRFPIPADGNSQDFGSGLQHHLRDFAHHPTIVGLIFSLLTQFTEMSYGTNTDGAFIVVPVPEKSRVFIGDNVPDKIFKGTVIWLFHLISDIAGSSSSAGLSGGTGLPGPIVSMLKEISALPFMKNVCVNDESLSKFLSTLFNGTLFAKHDEAGKIIKGTEIKLDFRGEIGAVAELGKQAIPVIANDCIVRTFYFIRHFASTLKENKISSIQEIRNYDWKPILPFNNPTISRMLLVATGVFTTIDVTEAVVTEKYFVSVNYVGVGRFSVALGTETMNYLKVRKVKEIKDMYERIQRNTYSKTDDRIYGRLNDTMDFEKFGLTIEQTEILYNIELQKTLNDIDHTSSPISAEDAKELKREWVEEWKKYMEMGFAGFMQVDDAKLHWFNRDELIEKINANNPDGVWYRLVLLEAMLFEPYYPLSIEKDKKGNDVPSKKYKSLQNPITGYKSGLGDEFLDENYLLGHTSEHYIARLRKTYTKVLHELNEVLKSALVGLAVTAGVALAAVLTAGMFAPAIAVVLVGSNFAGLSGAALTSACLAYLGGGAVAVGGLGMAGGTMAIVGGSAILGVGVGAGAGAAVTASGIAGKETTILQSAKLMVAVREIFLNDEHDVEYSNYVYEQYVNSIAEIEKQIVDLRLQQDVADKDEKKRLKQEIDNMEESVQAMKIAMKSMNRFNSAFETGLQADNQETEDSAESEKAEKVTYSVKKAAKAAAEGVAKGAGAVADGVAAGALKAADNIKATAKETVRKKAELEARKANIKEDRTNEANHTVLELKKSGIRLLIPDGYEKIKEEKTGDPRIDRAKEKLIYVKAVSTCDGYFIVFETPEEEAMDFSDKQDVIDGIHECMSDQQGLICVESGKTERGYDYIYSIVKTLSEELFTGVGYFVRMNIGYKGKIIEVQGTFQEARQTGIREAYGYGLARRAGLCEFDELEGWSEDPYNPEYNQGVRMNLAERVGLDALFPDNPLSQARELVRAILYDELMEEIEVGELFKEKDESDPDMSDEEVAQNEAQQKEDEKELLVSLFDKGEDCRRHSYSVKVK